MNTRINAPTGDLIHRAKSMPLLDPRQPEVREFLNFLEVHDHVGQVDIEVNYLDDYIYVTESRYARNRLPEEDGPTPEELANETTNNSQARTMWGDDGPGTC